MYYLARRVCCVSLAALLIFSIVSGGIPTAATTRDTTAFARPARKHRCIHDELQQTVLQKPSVFRTLPHETPPRRAAVPTTTPVEELPPRHRRLAGLPLPSVSLATSGSCLSVNGSGAKSRASLTTTAAPPTAKPDSSSSTSTSLTWGSLRVLVSTLDLTNPSSYCTPAKPWVRNKQGGAVTCAEEDVLTDEKRDILIHYLIPQALQLHTDRLHVQQLRNTWRVTTMSGVCSYFEVPEVHVTQGVNETDFILYVSSVPASDDVVAWAATCQVFDGDAHAEAEGRPVVGVLNIPAANVVSRYDQYMIRTVAHEIAHALGFSRTFFTHAGMLAHVDGIRGKAYAVPVLTSPKVTSATQAQYGCATTRHMELEDMGGPGTVASHFKLRNALNELMAPLAGPGYYTALTLAAFEDLGFYQADYAKAEEMPWGDKVGCDFLHEKCMEDGVTAWPEMFCPHDEIGFRCAPGRLSLGACAVDRFASDLPDYFQYFADTQLGGFEVYMDYCPFVLPWTFGHCAQSDTNALTHVEHFNVFSDSSRCIDGHFRPAVTSPEIQFYKGLCAAVTCDTRARTYALKVYGADEGVSCTPGRNVSLATASASFESGSYLTCPPYREVCQGNVQAVNNGASRDDGSGSNSSSSSNYGAGNKSQEINETTSTTTPTRSPSTTAASKTVMASPIQLLYMFVLLALLALLAMVTS